MNNQACIKMDAKSMKPKLYDDQILTNTMQVTVF